MVLRRCKKCGGEVSLSSKLCPHCGKKPESGILLRWIIGALIVLTVFYIIHRMNGNTSSGDSTKKTETINAKIGNEILVGNFIYRVENITFRKSIGNDLTREVADGIYLIINLTVKNIDKKTHTIDNSLFELVDATGTEYENSSIGSSILELSGYKTLFLKQCQPNIPTNGYLIFEVPSKNKVYYLKLSGGFWNGKTGKVILQ